MLTKECPICKASMAYIDKCDVRRLNDKIYSNDIFYCEKDDIFYKDVNDPFYFSSATYVALTHEEHYFIQRIKFFSYILKLAKKNCPSSTRNQLLLDFGSSYGHLLSLAEQMGFSAIGIEINDHLRTYCNRKGLSVFKFIEDVKENVDIITFIDSLYYLNNPKDILKKTYAILENEGVILIRVTNRNWLIKKRGLIKHLFKPFLPWKNLNILGDAVISYSIKGIVNLLSKTGYEITQIIPEPFSLKTIDFKKRIYYKLTYLFTLITFNKYIYTSGVIIIAKKNERKLI